MAKQAAAKQDKYVAYISSYTSGHKNNYGIRIYDVDLENGYLTEKERTCLELEQQILLFQHICNLFLSIHRGMAICFNSSSYPSVS